MKKNIALGLLVAGSFICLIFFQNCSKISTQDLVERSGEYKMTANNEDAGNIVNNDVIADVIADEAKPDVFEPKQAEEKKEDNPQPSEEVIVANDKNKEHVAEEADDDKDDSKAIAACLNKNFKHSITGSVFNNLHGKFKIVSNQIEEMSNNRAEDSAAKFSGTYNLVASGFTTWHGYAQHVLELAQARGIKLKAVPAAVLAITTEDYPLPAARPKNSRLNTTKLSNTFNLHLPHWHYHVQRLMDELIL